MPKPKRFTSPSTTRSTTSATSSSNLTRKLKLQPSQLAVAFRHIRPTWKHYLDYVESAAREGDKEMEKVLSTYHGLTRREQATVMPEQLCELAGVKTEVLFGAVCTQLWSASKMEANLITAVNFPRVIERTAKSALTKGGIRDREMFHKATGFIKTPTGPSISITNSPQTLITGGSGSPTPNRPLSLPSAEEEALAMEEAITLPALPAPIPSPCVDSTSSAIPFPLEVPGVSPAGNQPKD